MVTNENELRKERTLLVKTTFADQWNATFHKKRNMPINTCYRYLY